MKATASRWIWRLDYHFRRQQPETLPSVSTPFRRECPLNSTTWRHLAPEDKKSLLTNQTQSTAFHVRVSGRRSSSS
jgi:hypothetical protein